MTNEEWLLHENEELRKRLSRFEDVEEKSLIPTFSFSKIRDTDLEKLVDIKKIYDRAIFKDWFDFEYQFDEENIKFLNDLTERNELLISDYHEEDLKVNFIVPLITDVDFFMLEDGVRSFYNEKLVYKTDRFIFAGETDFVVSRGMQKAETPYFFIQGFKRAEEYSNPRPQLLAEMISGIELNKTKTIRGAFIIGETWRFAVLEKLEVDKYQYFVSQSFNCTNIEDLKKIYKNLQFVKNEIVKMVKEGRVKDKGI